MYHFIKVTGNINTDNWTAIGSLKCSPKGKKKTISLDDHLSGEKTRSEAGAKAGKGNGIETGTAVGVGTGTGTVDTVIVAGAKIGIENGEVGVGTGTGITTSKEVGHQTRGVGGQGHGTNTMDGGEAFQKVQSGKWLVACL